MKRLLLLFTLPLLTLASCVNDDITGDDPGITTGTGGDIRFEIGFAPQTKVATGADFNSTWEDGDEIGVFAVRNGQNLSALASGNYIHNVKLTYSSAGSGSWIAAEDMWWPNNNTKLDFYAYHPYDDNNGSPKTLNPTNMTVIVKTDQSAVTNGKSNYSLSDLMTAQADNGTKGYEKGATVSLQFAHEMSLVQVEISEREINVPVYQEDKLTVKLLGANTAVSLLNISTPETYKLLNIEKTDITMTRVKDAGTDKWVYRALVPRQPRGRGRLFHFEQEVDGIPGDSGMYDFSLSYNVEARQDFNQGQVTQYKVKLTYGDIDPDHKYELLDYYPHVGKPMGVVYWLDTTHEDYDTVTKSGTRGKIVSLDEAEEQWSSIIVNTFARDYSNGRNNMKTVYEFNNNSFGDYPAFDLVHAKNPSGTAYTADATGVWYLPTDIELATLNNIFSSDPTGFNGVLTAAGGEALSAGEYYWSSTECNAIAVSAINFGNSMTTDLTKSARYSVRAVLAFETPPPPTYKVGQYYPDPDVKYDPDSPGTVLSGTQATGVVFWLDTTHGDYDPVTKSGTRGKIVSLDEAEEQWSSKGVNTFARDYNNGRNNMKTVYEFNNNSFSGYPAFDRVHAKNPSGTAYTADATGVWYLPADIELVVLRSIFSSDPTGFNGILTAAGGEALSAGEHYLSSTEASANEAYAIDFGSFMTDLLNKSARCSVRAVLAF